MPQSVIGKITLRRDRSAYSSISLVAAWRVRIVNHAGGSRGGIAGVYNKSELLDKRRAALEHWAQHVERMVSGDSMGKVVPLRPERR